MGAIPDWVLNRIIGKIDHYFEPLMGKLDRIISVMEQIRDALKEKSNGA